MVRSAKTVLAIRSQPLKTQPTEEHAEYLDRLVPPPYARWLMLADIALLEIARQEQRRIKQKIKPHVERYRNLIGNKS